MNAASIARTPEPVWFNTPTCVRTPQPHPGLAEATATPMTNRNTRSPHTPPHKHPHRTRTVTLASPVPPQPPPPSPSPAHQTPRVDGLVRPPPALKPSVHAPAARTRTSGHTPMHGRASDKAAACRTRGRPIPQVALLGSTSMVYFPRSGFVLQRYVRVLRHLHTSTRKHNPCCTRLQESLLKQGPHTRSICRTCCT